MPTSAGRDRSSRPASPNFAVTLLLVLSVLLPAIVAYAILYRQALPVPYQDDYPAILAFATEYDHLPTLKARLLDIATRQHNEYKIAFEHSVVATELAISHQLNFGLLATLGDLFLLPLAYLLWRTGRVPQQDLDQSLLAFLPVSLIFFALSYWQNLNWAMTGLQNTPVIVFAFLAVYLLCGRQLFLSCVAAALSALSSANGFLLAPIGLVFLVRERAYRRALVWCATFVVPFAAYLYHYSAHADAPKALYATRALFFLGFLGGIIPARYPAAALGCTMLIVLVMALRFRFDRENPVAFYFTAWVFATALLVGWVRGVDGFVVISRYSIYSNLLLIFCYWFLAHCLIQRFPKIARRQFLVAAIAIAAGLCLMTDLNAYEKLGARRRMVLTGVEFYRANPQLNSPMVDPMVEISFPKEKKVEQDILNNAIRDHIYTLPPAQPPR